MDSFKQTDTLQVQAQQIAAYKGGGGVRLGPWTSYLYYNDPKHLAFTLARYKFVTEMFHNLDSVIEFGCGDAFGSTLVAQSVKKYAGLDFEGFVIEDNRARLSQFPNMEFYFHDILNAPHLSKYQAGFSLDVIEHIPKPDEFRFIENILASTEEGPILIGTPNIAASQYASKFSRDSHINLKSAESLACLLRPYFQTVLNFSMNDELVHTGYSQMAHYLISIGIGRR